MTNRVSEWLDGYINALLGERSAAGIAREAETDDDAVLMKTARKLKHHSGRSQMEPRPEFVASLEGALRQEMERTRPKIRPMPIWRLSRSRVLAGVATAAAAIMVVFLLRSAILLPVSSQRSPSTVALQQQEPGTNYAPEADSAASATSGAKADTRSNTAPPKPAAGVAAPAAAPAQARSLVEAVGEAETILVGQVTPVTGTASPAPSGTQVTISVERYLKGPLPGSQVTLRADPSSPAGALLLPGQRVLVLAKNVNGVLQPLPYPEAIFTSAAPGAAIAGDTAKSTEAGREQSLEGVIARVEGILKGGQ